TADGADDDGAAAEQQGSWTKLESELESDYGAPLNLERQLELQGYLDRWNFQSDHGRRRGPFHSVALQEADVSWLAAQMRGAAGTVPNLHLEGADLGGVQLAGIALREAHLEGANLGGADLTRADLRGAHLARAALGTAHLEEAALQGAHLEGVYLGNAHLEGAYLSDADLARADLRGAHLEGVSLEGAHLARADLRGAFVDVATNFNTATFEDARRVGPQLADLHWGSATLIGVDWERVRILGDEQEARRSRLKRAGARRGTAPRAGRRGTWRKARG